jgi:hypothetical protein
MLNRFTMEETRNSDFSVSDCVTKACLELDKPLYLAATALSAPAADASLFSGW